MCPYSVKMVVLTSKITPIEKGCKIFELTKVNLLFLVGLGPGKYDSVVALV
tara:strand:+ start:220 stop:372 length:153 start_codon:yes stop_codon:yes gene_type:complete